MFYVDVSRTLLHQFDDVVPDKQFICTLDASIVCFLILQFNTLVLGGNYSTYLCNDVNVCIYVWVPSIILFSIFIITPITIIAQLVLKSDDLLKQTASLKTRPQFDVVSWYLSYAV